MTTGCHLTWGGEGTGRGAESRDARAQTVENRRGSRMRYTHNSNRSKKKRRGEGGWGVQS